MAVLLADPVPVRKSATTRPWRVKQRSHSVKRDALAALLACQEDEHVVADLSPLQLHNLVPESFVPNIDQRSDHPCILVRKYRGSPGCKWVDSGAVVDLNNRATPQLSTCGASPAHCSVLSRPRLFVRNRPIRRFLRQHRPVGKRRIGIQLRCGDIRLGTLSIHSGVARDARALTSAPSQTIQYQTGPDW